MKVLKDLYQKLFKNIPNEKLGLMRDNMPSNLIKPLTGSKVFTPEESVEIKTHLKYTNPELFKTLFPEE